MEQWVGVYLGASYYCPFCCTVFYTSVSGFEDGSETIEVYFHMDTLCTFARFILARHAKLQYLSGIELDGNQFSFSYYRLSGCDICMEDEKAEFDTDW